MTQSDKSTTSLAFRGLMFGLLFALPIWAGIYLLLWLTIR